jgi:hypothetical protein
MNTDPARTLQLLAKLLPLGFDEAAFAVLHHRHGKLLDHQEYCQKVKTRFVADLNNARVQRRLEIVLDKCGGSPASQDDFRRLALEAVAQVPFVPGTDD